MSRQRILPGSQKSRAALPADGITWRGRPVVARAPVRKAEILEAIDASGLQSCFENGAPIHCELPPEREFEAEFGGGLGFFREYRTGER